MIIIQTITMIALQNHKVKQSFYTFTLFKCVVTIAFACQIHRQNRRVRCAKMYNEANKQAIN